MTGNIIDYVNQFQYSLKEREFNDVDSLVLCQLSYLKMKDLLPGLEDGKEFVSFREVTKKENAEKLFADERYRTDNEKLVKAVSESNRFANLKLNYFIDILNKEMEIQFSAVTFLLEAENEADSLYYIAYRGTDENLVGWKEDFTLAFSEPVAGQLYAARYMRKAAARLPGHFYIGGHSKGGNLAVFASMSGSEILQERIEKIYSHDGPGFKPQVMERYGYERIAEKVNKILPKSSMVGMLMEKGEAYRVVESSSFGLWQHNPYTWVVELENGKFKQAESLKNGVRVMNSAVTDWILNLDDEQISSFSDGLFRILAASETDNLIDLKADWKKSIMGILTELKEVDEETKREMEDIIKELFEITGQMTRKEIQDKMSESMREIQKKFGRNPDTFFRQIR